MSQLANIFIQQAGNAAARWAFRASYNATRNVMERREEARVSRKPEPVIAKSPTPAQVIIFRRTVGCGLLVAGFIAFINCPPLSAPGSGTARVMAALLAVFGVLLLSFARFGLDDAPSPAAPVHDVPAPKPNAPDWNAVFLDRVGVWARSNPDAFCREYFDLIRVNNPEFKFESQEHFDYTWRRVRADIEPALKEYLSALDWIRQHQPQVWPQIMAVHPR